MTIRIESTAMRPLWLALALVLLAAALSLPANAQGGIYPPDSTPNGNTYGEWSALWWRWFLSIDADEHPALGGDCATGQLGSVWYLATVPSVGAPRLVNCTIPSGKLLLIPLINVECSNVEPTPFYGESAEDRQKCANALMDRAASLAAWVDGKHVSNIKNFRFTSPNFSFVPHPNNLFGIEASTGEAVGDGYYLMLAPMSPGTHTIRVMGSLHVRLDDPPPAQVRIDTTFVINVQ
ncbi:MAG: hypothetical protein KIT09_29465 [Bryobacteraceae bacterium]|nr:hypothetical protein [Bryobacteraceae bacterium]